MQEISAKSRDKSKKLESKVQEGSLQDARGRLQEQTEQEARHQKNKPARKNLETSRAGKVKVWS